jgi:DNA polymerase III gamma/tau subunit
MVKKIRRKIKKAFRELLLYHHSSLEYRAKVLTLVVAVNEDISPCEEELLYAIACEIYNNDEERAEILVEAVKEYFDKIITDNNLNFEHLVFQVEKETKAIKRFAKKIDIEALKKFQSCIDNEEDKIYQQRVIEYLSDLKDRYGSV